ncbi:Crp/Fnr family transcriptional regulator [Streptomyces sp. NPDC002962]|uniref:Crp/Fnr family transcriptional regulator n=1 Tax=Streptomyces sp. NPDC002962 TaxID=3364674 RepID=UPI0036C704A2
MNPPVRVLRERYRRRQGFLLPFARSLFRDQGLSDPAIEGIADIAVVRTSERGAVSFRSEQGRVYLLHSGCVREEFPDGTVRLWRGGALIGDWTRGTGGTGSVVTVLSKTSMGLVLTPGALQQLAAEQGQVVYALGRMSMDRLRAAETVYGANGRRPTERLATLLLFLATDFGYESHDSEGQRLVTVAMGGVVRGPTQADFADALGLSRAAVEKAIAVLRQRGVLRKPDPGERRTNRRYVIADREALEQVARGL